MNKKHILFTLVAMALITKAALGQSYAIDWFTIDGGGGASAGGGYSLNGSIGQHDATTVTMSGGSYSMTGGFWSLVAVQTPGAPLLKIFFTATNTAVISWPSASTGFTVQQQNGQLNPTGWTTAPQTVADNGTNKYIIVNPPTGTRYYRLFKP